jgi:glutaminyl-peptide cyclotransferase
LIVAALGVLLGLIACRAAPPVPPVQVGGVQATSVPATGPAEHLAVQVLATYPHDTGSFTEGLVLANRALYESSGLYGRSALQETEPTTGTVLQRIMLNPAVFGEGLALVDDQLIQLTWKEQIAYIYDVASFAPLGQRSYEGEGWGLCYDGSQLVMSNGSSSLTFRDPDSFEPIGQLPVTLDGQPLAQLNELECVGDSVYANVWLTDQIVRIDEATGRVTAVIDASGLLTPEEHRGADVLNGIAYDPATGHFLITGKDWPKLFEVQFAQALNSSLTTG